MDAHLVLASKQEDLFARWQLLAAGWNHEMVRHRARYEAWRAIHSGVYTRMQGPLTQRQNWIAAVLTAPITYLDARSAAACYGYWPWDGDYETVVRRGNGGKRGYPGLLVARSSTLDGQVDKKDGIPIVLAERSLINLAPDLGTWQLGKAFREACRLQCLTADSLARALCGQRGTALLAALCDRYATIPYHRCRSDAECRGLEILHDAGIEPPRVNVRVRGHRPDFYWPQWRYIIEIDGPQWHLFADEDARKQKIWEDARNTVRRIPSGDVYDHPERLVALARQGERPKEGAIGP